MPLFDKIGRPGKAGAQHEKKAAFRDAADMQAQYRAQRGQYHGTQADAQAEVMRMVREGRVSPQILELGQYLVDKFLGGKK